MSVFSSSCMGLGGSGLVGPSGRLSPRPEDSAQYLFPSLNKFYKSEKALRALEISRLSQPTSLTSAGLAFFPKGLPHPPPPPTRLGSYFLVPNVSSLLFNLTTAIDARPAL